MKRQILLLSLISLIPSLIFSQFNSMLTPDSSSVREGLVENWFLSPIKDIRERTPEVYQNSIGEKFQVYSEENEKYLCVFVSPRATIKMDVYTDKGHTTEDYDIYPGDGEGSFALYIDKKDEDHRFIRYYFMKDSSVYIEIANYNKSALASFVVFNTCVYENVATGLPFSKFYTLSFSTIKELTSKTLPWEYSVVYNDNYHATLQMIGVIREKLPSIIYTEDAIYNENNEAVSLTSGEKRQNERRVKGKVYLDKYGFLKWIADGIIEPITGSKLKRAPLLVPTVKFNNVDYQGILSEEYNLTLSLDWIRNLSTAIISLRTKKHYLYNESGCDVTTFPFSSTIQKDGVHKNITPYVKDTGYKAALLKPLLYILAITEPDTFYLCAITSTKIAEPGLKVFNDCAVLFPYFNYDGRFKCAVFTEGKEESLEDFIDKCGEEFCALTRVRATEQFFPQ